MSNIQASIILDLFNCNTREAVARASKLGADGLQINTTGKFAPQNMSPSSRRELLDIIRSNGMKIAVVCGDMGVDFSQLDRNIHLIERSKRILDLAVDLDAHIVTSDIGIVPKDIYNPRFAIMQEACREVAQYAAPMDTIFAIDSSEGTAENLKCFLDSLGTKGIAVNFDLRDSYDEMVILKNYIVHSYANEVTAEHLKGFNDIGYNGFITIFDRSKDKQEENIEQKLIRFKNLISK